MKLKLIVLLTLPLLAANVARADDSDVKGPDYYMDPPSQSDDEADVTGSMLNDAAHTIDFAAVRQNALKKFAPRWKISAATLITCIRSSR